jgi:hypothetical protein
LNSGPSPWATPPALFLWRVFQNKVSWTICLGWSSWSLPPEKLGLQVWATGAWLRFILLTSGNPYFYSNVLVGKGPSMATLNPDYNLWLSAIKYMWPDLYLQGSTGLHEIWHIAPQVNKKE